MQQIIARLNTVIGQINQASVSIAGAVEQQMATTQQMSALINGAVTKVSTINRTIEKMTSNVDSTAACAQQTEAAANLAGSTNEVQKMSARFVTECRLECLLKRKWWSLRCTFRVNDEQIIDHRKNLN